MNMPSTSAMKPETERMAGMMPPIFGARKNGARALTVAALSRNHETLKNLRDCVAESDASIQLQIWPGDAAHLAAMVEQERPGVLLLEGHGVHEAELEALEDVTRRHPTLAVILLCARPSPEFLLRALRIGVSEVMPLPVTQPALQLAIDRVRERLDAVAAPQRQGKVLAVLPCKGGAGATFLATNLAHAVAAEGKRVCLIDLNLHFGEASLYVSEANPPATLAEVAGQIQRLDGALLESSMLRIAPNFWLLAAPDTPEKAMDIRPESIERLLGVARASYDFVLLDVSRTLDANSIKALDGADDIYLVLQTTLPFIRDAKRLLTLFRSLSYPEAKMHLLVNRYEKGGDIDLKDVERTLGLAVTKTVANSFGNVAISINQGRPIIDLAPRDAVSMALREMARDLAQTKPPAEGWLRRQFGHRT